MAPRSLLLKAATAAVLAVAANAQSPNAATQGEWTTLSENAGVVPIHMLYLPGDKIVITERIHVLPTDQYDPAIMEAFRGSGFYNDNKNLGEFLTDTAVFDLKTKQFQMIDYIPKVEEVGKNQGYAFCMGHSHLADGSILGAGGDQFWWHTYKGVNMTSDGRRDVRVWTEESNTWTSVAKMPPGPNGNNTFSGRWYPTVITLPDEKAMILGGHTVYYDPAQPLANNPTYEMYHPIPNN
ncbi:hypothetical protein BC832DRAFT_318477 [Gaertneriomyces semiglobifer]|nr:hypothetical protein BC832DRAFT_318477 [Gaertneriomyces semiglobifer]